MSGSALYAPLLLGILLVLFLRNLSNSYHSGVAKIQLSETASALPIGRTGTVRQEQADGIDRTHGPGAPAGFMAGTFAPASHGLGSRSVSANEVRDVGMKPIEGNALANSSEPQHLEERKRSWCACEACMEAHDPLSYVCIGGKDGLQRVKELSGRTKGSCNACEDCPNCESCSVEVTPLGAHLGSVRSGHNHMRLVKMVDSSGAHFLAKVTNNPPLHKVTAVERVVKRCGFEDIVPRERKGPLFSKVRTASGDRLLTASTAIFSEMKAGRWVQLPERNEQVMATLNKTQVARAALFTFLFQAGDSMRKNVLYDPDTGSIYLIDNLEHGLCVDCRTTPGSIFYPGNLRFYLIEGSSAQSVYNYQLFVGNSRIEKEYSKQVRWCLNDMASSDLSSLSSKYGMPSTIDAVRIRERAKWMLEGFEVAIWKHFCKYYADSDIYAYFVRRIDRKWSKERVGNMTDMLTKVKGRRCKH